MSGGHAAAVDSGSCSEEDQLEPTLRSIVHQKELKWIFVGGKGGVGKTTTSCCLSVQLSKVRENVLLISTDPAHNLSDAFQQKFSGEPTLVQGFQNLFAMEVDSSKGAESSLLDESEDGSFINDIAGSIPGIDEALGFAEVMKQVETMDYSVVVFDTAPTGHTLRLLQLPQVLDRALDKMLGMKGIMGSILPTLQSFMGNASNGDGAAGNILGKVEELKGLVSRVREQFGDPDLTTFVCVCIPEFLSLYETERLVQDLAEYDIDSHNIVINQVLFPEQACGSKLLLARCRMQEKYLRQYEDLYEDFHLVKTPLLEEEIRGVPALEHFSEHLLSPWAHQEDISKVASETEDGASSDAAVAALQREVARLKSQCALLEKQLLAARAQN